MKQTSHARPVDARTPERR
ncbi:MAG: hypothetical protein JSR42_19090 [Proteobacteria bacterium]|nr:hypothetical protein [Pseudomonadota bacterium]MBS0554772.1 hypothetical protein [Pseudomonadota bacterium]